MKRTLVSIAFIIISLVGHSQQIKLHNPLKGMPSKDYFIDYYVDHDPTKNIKDPYCGKKTYNGHTGTDFLLKNFRAMDKGVTIYAALSGKVYNVRDGLYDRSKRWAGGDFGNYVCVLYDDKYYVFYCHMKKGSACVKVGDTIAVGQPLGQVGSSGYSCYPHLHFEIRDTYNYIIDPFIGNCQTGSPFSWVDKPPYDTALYCIDNGFIPYKPGLDTLLERYLLTDTFHIKEDTTVCFWVQMHGLQSGCKVRYDWYTPDQRLWFTSKFVWVYNWWYDYSWAYIDMPKRKGSWVVKLYVNDTLVANRNFYVVR